MVIDNATGLVESLNWEPKDLTQTRDYAVATTQGREVAEMVRCFDADWERTQFTPDPDSRLMWCPNNGRRRMAGFIDATKHTLWLQNERYQDPVIIERLVLLADLKKREGLDPEKLVLYEDIEHWGYHHDGHHGKHDGKHGHKHHAARARK